MLAKIAADKLADKQEEAEYARLSDTESSSSSSCVSSLEEYSECDDYDEDDDDDYGELKCAELDDYMESVACDDLMADVDRCVMSAEMDDPFMLKEEEEEEEEERAAPVKRKKAAPAKKAKKEKADKPKAKAKPPKKKDEEKKADEKKPAPKKPPTDAKKAADDDNNNDTDERALPSASNKSREIDFTSVPAALDEAFGRLSDDGAVRPTKIIIGDEWRRSAMRSLLAQVREETIDVEERRRETLRAFDLLDALCKSGALPLQWTELHSVVLNTHHFVRSLIQTLTRDNINPIERAERSLMIIGSLLHAEPAAKIIRPQQIERATLYSPQLFAAVDEDEEDESASDEQQ